MRMRNDFCVFASSNSNTSDWYELRSCTLNLSRPINWSVFEDWILVFQIIKQIHSEIWKKIKFRKECRKKSTSDLATIRMLFIPLTSFSSVYTYLHNYITLVFTLAFCHLYLAFPSIAITKCVNVLAINVLWRHFTGFMLYKVLDVPEFIYSFRCLWILDYFQSLLLPLWGAS